MRKTTKCIDCRVEFTYEHRTGPTRQRCEECRTAHRFVSGRARQKKWRDANRDKHVAYLRQYHQDRKDDPEYRRKRREAMVRYSYGLSQVDLDALIAEQGGRCAICGGPPNGPGKRLHIDHCHNSKKIRGLLCGKCNTGLGLFDNDPVRLRAAAKYLKT